MSDNIRETPTITIIGAGLAGSLLAVMLGRQGFDVEVFERNPDPRKDATVAGRSINLALSERGIHALSQVGLEHRVGRFALPMAGRMVHQPGEAPVLQPYGIDDDEVIYSVHRARLNAALLDAAESGKRVRIHFNQSLQDIDFEHNKILFKDEVSGREYQRTQFPVIAADGAGSPARQALEKFTGDQAEVQLLDHGYQEFRIAPSSGGHFRLEPRALHIWPRGGFMMIALPNTDGSFTNTLFLANAEHEHSFEQLGSVADYRRFFATHFAEALPLLDDFDHDALHNPVGILGTIRTPRWHVDARLTLLGDAAHAIVPFHGQGMNCAFEDCVSLSRLISENTRWSTVFEQFAAERIDQANAIADMALENYIEMRSAVIDSHYLIRRTMAQRLEREFPGRFMSRYAMVMFTRIPYATVFRRGLINLQIIAELRSRIDSDDPATCARMIDLDAAETLISQQLDPIDPALMKGEPLATRRYEIGG